MEAALSVGSIVLLKNGRADGGYLDTYGWVADKPAFWNVAGTERIFVSTHGGADRGGGTTSWRIVSADGKAEGAALAVGDRVHLLNMYPEAGYLDCCGWIEDLPLFSAHVGQVTCGVFTSGARDRDNGTGVWALRSAAGDADGTPLYEGAAVWLENGHADTGFLVAHGKVTANPVFADFVGQQYIVFTSAVGPPGEAATWSLALSHLDTAARPALFDFSRPELLKGRSSNMEAVRTMTDLALRDALAALAGLALADVADLPQAADKPQALNTLLAKARSGLRQQIDTAIDYDFQLRQLLNLYLLNQTLRTFDQNTLYKLMEDALRAQQQKQAIAPLSLVRQCFQSLAIDYELIQRAAMQRRWTYNDADGSYYQSKQAEELLMMDKLALRALSPFQHLLPDQAKALALITYFSETTHIRRLPYAKQFLLLGVSYDRIAPAEREKLSEPYFSAFELMAIPHEVGHYLYQHGRLASGQSFADLSAPFAGQPYYHWCEEIFADLYGCAVAGPLSVFGLQAFLTSGDTERAWRDDDEHPTPILRCYILSEILRVLSALETQTPPRYQFARVIRRLDADWSKTLEGWSYQRVDTGEGRPARLFVPGDLAYTERIFNVERVISAVRPLIVTFATALLAALDDRQPAAAIPWSRSDDDNAAVYAREMAALTGRATARAAVHPVDLFASVESVAAMEVGEAAEQLRRYLDAWGERGPSGGGGGTYR